MIDSNPNFSYLTGDFIEKGEGATNEEEEEEDEYVEIKPSEFIFLIDRSGSMTGDRISLAVEALKLFVHSIPYGSKFNIVSYGSNY